MKKRLLITSIVMMLVVAVALSTATYAWFTSNSKVEASSVTMTAAVNSEAAIGIAWLGSDAGKTALAAVAGSALNPMIPDTFTLTTTKDSEMGYTSSTVYSDDNGTTYKFNADGDTANPYIWHDASTPTAIETFYIRNLSETTPVNVTITIDIKDFVADATVEALEAGTTLAAGVEYYKKNGTDDYTLLVAGAEGDYTAGTTKAGSGEGNIGYDVYKVKTNSDVSGLVRVAVFTCDTEDGNYVLSNVFSEVGGTNVSSGDIEANALTTSVQNKQTSIAEKTATALKSNLAGVTNVYVRVHVWLDGDGFYDVLGGGKANVALTFDAAKA